MRTLALILMALIALSPNAAVRAQEVAPLMKGQPAPFSGLLVTEGRFTSLLEMEIEASDLAGQLEIQKRLTSNLEVLYTRKLEAAVEEPAWYEKPSFNRWLGFGIGVAVTVLAVYGASQLKRAMD